jgi:hypothetical protein
MIQNPANSPTCPRYDAKYLWRPNHGEKHGLVGIFRHLTDYSCPERSVPNRSTMTANYAAADLPMLFSGPGGGFPLVHWGNRRNVLQRCSISVLTLPSLQSQHEYPLRLLVKRAQ